MIKLHDSIVVQKVAHYLTPFIQIFALYVLFHGHHSPGGGFQAGVLLGASLILRMLVGTREEAETYQVWRECKIAIGGLLVYALTGAAGLLFGSDFLDYGSLTPLASDPEMRRFYGIYIIETGVTMTVAMTLVIIFNVLALSGRNIKGLQA